jgi:MoxR-like ATPase
MAERIRIMSEPLYTGQGTDFYVASERVADSVNLAVDLKRPILVEGEPGCGKTRLAYSIAAEKGLGDPIKIMVKSTSRAKDLLYQVNYLRRLQDAQSSQNPDARYIYPYLSLEPLGQALHQNRRCVVLIDEIDKADIDFPNDLLDVLEEFAFEIPDLPQEEDALCLDNKGFGRRIVCDTPTPPIVVITSNREKRLPDPFLRRCLYIRLRFPDTAAELINIVEKNIDLSPHELSQKLLVAAVESFLRVRNAALISSQKPPTTSELIDWVKIIYWKEKTVEELNQSPFLPPYWELLFKNMNDIDAYLAQIQSTT